MWDTQAPSSEAEDDDSSALDDPIGLGPLLRDKVSELGYTSKSAPADATNGKSPTHTSTNIIPAMCMEALREGLVPGATVWCSQPICEHCNGRGRIRVSNDGRL